MYALLCALLTALLFYKLFFIKRPPNFPPGPRLVIPILNISLVEAYKMLIGQDEIEKHKEYRKRYGDVYSLIAGGEWLIFISDYHDNKVALNKESTNFRPAGDDDFRKAYADFRGGNGFVGIVDSVENVWKEQRRFAMHNLKNLGFGKSSMEAQIMDEIQAFISDLDCKILQNDEIDFGVSFNISVMNVLSRMISGTRFNNDNMEDRKLFNAITKLFEVLDPTKIIVAFGLPYSWKEYNPYYKKAMKHIKSMYDMFAEQKKKHLISFDPDDMRDYMDCYLREMKTATEEGKQESSFYGEEGEINLKASLSDLYLAGSETSSTTLLFSIIYMVNHPEVQEKVQAEIDRVVGQDRLPSLEDRKKLPFLDATISEVQRCSNVAHLSVVHSNTLETVEIGGYTIPKGAVLVPNLAAIMLDPKNFHNPEQFSPERFISESSGEYMSPPMFAPFGIGKRECPGKSLAKMELFLFFATLLQQFVFLPTKSGAPNVNAVTYTLTRAPRQFKIKVVRRIETQRR